MPKIPVISHILHDVVHGGYDDPASVSLWIDQTKMVAHLIGHSGDPIPLAGPSAPQGAPLWDATGPTGYVMTADEDEIEELRQELETILEDYIADRQNPAFDAMIRDCLESLDLMQESYEDWTAANEPETHADLYG